jgi:hypothetical protein
VSKPALILSALFLAGCGAQRDVRVNAAPKTGTYAYSLPADLRAAYVRSDTGVRVCSEPSPDVALKSTAELGATLANKTPTTDQSAKLESSLLVEVVQLAGRNSRTLMAREVLYRICETSANLDLDPAATTQLWTMAIEYLQKYAELEIQAEITAQRKAEAAAKASEEEIQRLKLQRSPD